MSRFISFIRSLLFVVIMTIVTIPWACICFICLPLPYAARYFITSRWNVFMIWLAKVLCGIRYEVRGMHNLPDTPAILLCKHQSAWETIFLLCKMPRPLIFVLKKELLYVPFFGWALALLRMIPIDRSKARDAFAQVVVHGRNRLADGQWVIMFPEGTRTAVGSQGKYKGGGARLAVETGAVVVPIAVNSGNCWPKNAFIKTPGLVTVSIGPTISSIGKDPARLMQEVENWIESEMRVISPAQYSGPFIQK